MAFFKEKKSEVRTSHHERSSTVSQSERFALSSEPTFEAQRRAFDALADEAPQPFTSTHASFFKARGKWIYPEGKDPREKAARAYTYSLEAVAAFLGFVLTRQLWVAYKLGEGGINSLFGGTLLGAGLLLSGCFLVGFCAGNFASASETGGILGSVSRFFVGWSIFIGSLLAIGALVGAITLNPAVPVGFMAYVAGFLVGKK